MHPRLRAPQERRCTAVDTRFIENSWDGAPSGRSAWIDAISTTHGLHCRLDATCSAPSIAHLVHAGQTDIINVDIAWQSVSPVMQRPASWNGDHLFVKVVRSGMMSVEQRGQTVRFGP